MTTSEIITENIKQAIINMSWMDEGQRKIALGNCRLDFSKTYLLKGFTNKFVKLAWINGREEVPVHAKVEKREYGNRIAFKIVAEGWRFIEEIPSLSVALPDDEDLVRTPQMGKCTQCGSTFNQAPDGTDKIYTECDACRKKPGDQKVYDGKIMGAKEGKLYLICWYYVANFGHMMVRAKDEADALQYCMWGGRRDIKFIVTEVNAESMPVMFNFG